MDIKKEILDYIICNETTGALLLTGPWGCGKSFIIKQIAKESNKNGEAAIAVISLFGLDSVYAINKRVKEEYSIFKLGTMSKAVNNKFSKGIAKIAKDGLAVAGIVSPGITSLSAASYGLSSVFSYDILSFIDVKDKIVSKDSERKFVIVFDDLERSGIDNKKDLLGVINDFVENKHIKVILVADEKKIDEEEYKEYKEKIISRTVRMSEDYDSIIGNILCNYSETTVGYKEFLNKNIDLLKQLFFEDKTFNFRTFKCILADFERVYRTWCDSGISTENMKWALYSFGADVYTSKKPKLNEGSEDKEIYSVFPSKKNEQYSIKGRCQSDFNSFNYWINQGVWDSDKFIDELSQKYLIIEKTPLQRFLTYDFWNLQQKDIDEGLPQAVLLAYDGMLSKDQLITLIGKIHFIRENEIPMRTFIDYKKMEEGLTLRLGKIQRGEINEPSSHTFIERKNIDNEAESLYGMLLELDNKIVSIENKSKFIQYLSGDDLISRYSINGLCIDEFDDELYTTFKNKYITSDNQGKRDVAYALLGLSFDSCYSNPENIRCTKNNFEKLINCINEIKEDDAIARLLNESLSEKIEDKIRKLTEM